jgi:predicted nucleotidyltransferase
MRIESTEIDRLVQRIVEIVHPLRIILFGSAARGEIGPNNDNERWWRHPTIRST